MNNPSKLTTTPDAFADFLAECTTLAAEKKKARASTPKHAKIEKLDADGFVIPPPPTALQQKVIRMKRLDCPSWQHIRRVTLVRHIHCTSCNTTQSAQNEHPLVEKVHPKYGTISETYPEGAFQDLPSSLTHSTTEVKECIHCAAEAQAPQGDDA